MTKIYYLHRLFPNNHFQKGDKEIIENIVDLIQKKDDLSIVNIAKANFISPSSVSRLAKRAGFNNYREFIFFLNTKFSEPSFSTPTIFPFVNTNKEWKEIDNLLYETFSTKKIYLFGEGFCQFLVDYMYRKLLLKKIYTINLNGVEVSHISDNTPYTLITFSHSGENSNGLIKMKECKEYGGKIISITATENSSYTKQSDVSFIVESGVDFVDRENLNLNYFFGNSLNLIEFLIDKYSKKL